MNSPRTGLAFHKEEDYREPWLSIGGGCLPNHRGLRGHAIRKGQVRWVAKGDAIGQRQFIHNIFGIAA